MITSCFFCFGSNSTILQQRTLLLIWRPFDEGFDKRWSNLLLWAADNDVFVSEKLFLAAFAHAGLSHKLRGIGALRNIAAGELLVRVGARAMLLNSSEALVGRARTAFLFESQHRQLHRTCDACDLIAMLMLDERRVNHESFWAAHLRMLEMSAHLASVHPMLGSTQRFVVNDPTLHVFVTENRRLARKCYESILTLDDTRRLPILGSLDAPAPHVNFHSFLRASLECSSVENTEYCVVRLICVCL